VCVCVCVCLCVCVVYVCGGVICTIVGQGGGVEVGVRVCVCGVLCRIVEQGGARRRRSSRSRCARVCVVVCYAALSGKEEEE